MRVGLFGGSFNPIHLGHVHLAESVRDALSLDRVVLVPSRRSPHKSNDEYVSDEHRLNMCRLAVEGIPGFEVSDYELLRDTVSYTVYTVRHFREVYPDGTLYLLIGSDMLLSFDTWKDYRTILRDVSLAVVSRERGDVGRLLEKSEELSRYGEVVLVEAPPMEVSSTQIRKNIRNSVEYSCNLDEKVVQYIESNGLYLG